MPFALQNGYWIEPVFQNVCSFNYPEHFLTEATRAHPPAQRAILERGKRSLPRFTIRQNSST